MLPPSIFASMVVATPGGSKEVNIVMSDNILLFYKQPHYNNIKKYK